MGDIEGLPGCDLFLAGFGRASAGGDTGENEAPLKVGDAAVELDSEADISEDVVGAECGEVGGDEEMESRRCIEACWTWRSIYRWIMTAYVYERARQLLSPTSDKRKPIDFV